MGTAAGQTLRDVLVARQRNLPVRVLTAPVAAALVAALAGPRAWPLLVWGAIYVAFQVGEHLFNRRVLARSAQGLTRAEQGVVVCNLAISSLTFILGALLMLALRLTLAPSLSILMAAGSLMNCIVLSRRSLAAFLALTLPSIGWLLMMPVLMAVRGPHLTLAPAVGLGAAMLCANAVLAWLSLSRALRAAADARMESEARRIEAEAARDGRAAFTAAVSHELRTPLSAILAASAALQARAQTEDVRDSAVMIADASRLMRRLLDDLLDLSKLEAGRMAVEAADFDLPLLIDETLRLWAPEAAAKGLILAVEGRETLPVGAGGDPLRLRQVLNNLLSNAIKFTDRGEVRLELASQAFESGWRVHLAVADTGPGLETDATDRLFSPFEQASAGVARTHGGTGLGLAISRELARLMGGDVTAHRRTDVQGARFVLELPLSRPQAGAVKAPVPHEPDAALRVLVVDDQPLGRQALNVLLALRGFEVRLCDGPAAALVLLGAASFELVLTDLNMGAMDGRMMTRLLREGGGPNADTPVLAVSGDTGAQTLASCLAAGMEGLAAKPLEPRALYAAVDAALASRRAAPICDARRIDNAGASFSSHSQTVTTVQPLSANAA